MSTPTVGATQNVPCPADCVGGGWDKTSEDCPTCNYAGGTITATWTGVTTAAVGKGTCPTTKTIQCAAKTNNCEVPCQGSWSGWVGNYTCPTACGSAQVTLTRTNTWTTSTAPTGQTYVNCPSPTTQSKTCPATTRCCTYGSEYASGTCGQYESGKQLYRKDANNAPCSGPSYKDRYEDCAPCSGGDWDRTLSLSDCPTSCGYAGGTLTATWVGATQAVGTGTACPTTKSITCEATTPCCAYDSKEYAHGYCGQYTPGKQLYRKDASNTPCSGPAYQERSQDCAPCSGGSWDTTAASCPTYCGYAGGTLIATWVGATPPVGTGTACPTTTSITCPSTLPCCRYDGEEYYKGSCSDYENYYQRVYKSATNTPCIGPSQVYVRKEYCAPCSGGGYAPECPTHCGYDAAYIVQTWEGATPPVGTGSPCPSWRYKLCPSTSRCPYTPIISETASVGSSIGKFFKKF